MSLYLAPKGIGQDRLRSVAKELACPGKATSMEIGEPGWIWVDDDPERFGPAIDMRTGVRVVTSGRLAWSANDWARAAKLPYNGGLASRLVLERYLDRGAGAVAPFNGSAVIVVHDPRSAQIHLWTDQFGYHPCFLYRSDDVGNCIITTFPDLVLADPGVQATYDYVSMAEFLRAWRATPPNTYFSEIKHAGAAKHITVDLRGGSIRSEDYWTPFDDGFFPSMSAAAEELAGAVRLAIAERTAVAEHPVVFISGGADSRVLLFCAEDPGRITAVNLYERPAAELDVARRLAELAGSRFAAFQRDTDFYPRNLPDTVRWSGAMWSIEDAHYSGFADEVRGFDADLVMTACTTDWVFKGYGLEKRCLTLFGRNLPFYGYLGQRTDGFLPNYPRRSPTELAGSIDARMAAWFAGTPATLTIPRDRLLVEDRRVRPAAYTVSVSGPIMYRTFPYDTFLADSRIAFCYSRTHPDWKLNHELWGKAVALLSGGAGSVVNSNYGWRVNASMPEKAAMFAAGWLRRRLQRSAPGDQDDDRPPSSGSWPDFSWYMRHSPTLDKFWNSATAEERERMEYVSGEKPWNKPLAEWAGGAPLATRMLTLLAHWRESDARRQRAEPSAPIAASGGGRSAPG